MTLADQNDRIDPIPADDDAANPQPAAQLPPEASSPAGTPSLPDAGPDAATAAPDDPTSESARRRILIGSQRDPAAYRARQRRDWTPIEETAKREGGKRKKDGGRRTDKPTPPESKPAAPAAPSATVDRAPELDDSQAARQPVVPDAAPTSVVTAVARPTFAARTPDAPPASAGPVRSFPPPNIREKLSPEMEDELSLALGDASFDELMGVDAAKSEEVMLEPESLQTGRVVAVRRDDVFVELGRREQGIVSLRQFDVPPAPGAVVQLMVQRFNPEDGLYELSVPNKAVQVDDWSDLVEGKLVEIHVTGHNAGGLECEVNHIRGFIPVSQIALYRVEDLAQFVDQRMTCVITEADPDRRNLVLSRRAVLEREREQAKQQMLATLQPGQVHDGVVRKLMDFGAFVDIGGVDGLLHISQLAWGRVKHPSDVLQEGQKIRVRIDKVDPDTGKISLAYRDLMESPWTDVARKYPPNSPARGTVTKLMDFGAFVELEPGVEGLVHISELSHKRVWRASDVVHEGDQVDVLVLSIDTEAQRISLSMKAMSAAPEPAKKEEEPAEAAPVKPSQKSKREGPLLGGLGRATGGDRFGLKW